MCHEILYVRKYLLFDFQVYRNMTMFFFEVQNLQKPDSYNEWQLVRSSNGRFPLRGKLPLYIYIYPFFSPFGARFRFQPSSIIRCIPLVLYIVFHNFNIGTYWLCNRSCERSYFLNVFIQSDSFIENSTKYILIPES